MISESEGEEWVPITDTEVIRKEIARLQKEIAKLETAIAHLEATLKARVES